MFFAPFFKTSEISIWKTFKQVCPDWKKTVKEASLAKQCSSFMNWMRGDVAADAAPC